MCQKVILSCPAIQCLGKEMWLIHPSFRKVSFRSPVLHPSLLSATKPVTSRTSRKPHQQASPGSPRDRTVIRRDKEESKHQSPPLHSSRNLHSPPSALLSPQGLYFPTSVKQCLKESLQLAISHQFFISPRPVSNTLKGTFFFFYLFSPSCFLSNRIISQSII